MSDKVYDILKIISQIILPAIAALYVSIAGMWGLPFSEQIGGTVMAIDTFLGAILMISNKNYKKKKGEQEDVN